MSYDVERSLIEAHFKAEWEDLYPTWKRHKGGQIGYDEQEFTPIVGEENAKLDILSGDAAQISVGSPGVNLVRYALVITVMCYAPSNEGSVAVRKLADSVVEVFQNKELTDTDSGVVVKTRIPFVLTKQTIQPHLVWTMATPCQRDVFNG